MMKKLLLFTLINIIGFYSFGQNIAKIDAKTGFREFILGSSIKNYKNLKQEELDADNETKYSVIGKIKPLGENKIHEITIFAYKGILMHILINVDGNFDEYYPIFKETYGKGQYSASKLSGQFCIWKGKKTSIHLSDSNDGGFPIKKTVEIRYSKEILPVNSKSKIKSEI